MNASYSVALALMAVSLDFAGQAHAQVTQSTSLRGYSCEEWKQRDPETSYASAGWILGYLTGINGIWDALKQHPSDPLSGIKSNKAIFVWLDNYCRDNPRNSITDGGAKLFFELVERKRTAK